MKPRKKSSSGDHGRDHAYIAMVPEQDRERAEIRRNLKTQAGTEGSIEIWRNNILTWYKY